MYLHATSSALFSANLISDSNQTPSAGGAQTVSVSHYPNAESVNFGNYKAEYEANLFKKYEKEIDENI